MGQGGKGRNSVSVICHYDLSMIVEIIAGHLVDVKSHDPLFSRLRSQANPLQDN
jgi:hypothetical protein